MQGAAAKGRTCIQEGSMKRSIWLRLPIVIAAGSLLLNVASASASPGTDVRLTHDETAGSYVSAYTLATGTAYTDPTLAECSRSRGRQNEPAVAVDPRDTRVLIGSSNDYCGVYNNGSDANGAPRSEERRVGKEVRW